MFITSLDWLFIPLFESDAANQSIFLLATIWWVIIINNCWYFSDIPSIELWNHKFFFHIVSSAESPSKKLETPPKPKKVGISQIASVVAEVYGSRLVSGPGSEQPTIPLQQKLLICTFLLMTKERNTKEVVLGKVRKNLQFRFHSDQPFNSHEWPRLNFPLQYQYNIKQHVMRIKVDNK